MQDSFDSIVVLEKPEIKCCLKANIRSLHSMLKEKLKTKIKNIKTIRILVEDPQLIDYFRKVKM